MKAEIQQEQAEITEIEISVISVTSCSNSENKKYKMKTKNKQNLLAAALVGALALTAITSLHAEQSGSGHYLPGATASFIDASPGKPGWVAENIFMNYSDGTIGGGRELPFGGNIALNVTANATADIPLVMFSPDYKILGALPSFAVAVPIVWMDIKASGTIDSHGLSVSANREDKASGLGDIELIPLMLGWTKGDFKYGAVCAVYAPTGEYDKSQLANAGLGYWTFSPEVTFSWLSSKIGTEVSLFTGLDFNTKNTDADYQSGDLFHVDATVAQHLPLFGGFAGVGANGFYIKQISGDSGSGARLGGFEAETYGVGPVLSYAHKIGKHDLVCEAKWLPQLDSKNTTKGNYVWVKIALIF